MAKSLNDRRHNFINNVIDAMDRLREERDNIPTGADKYDRAQRDYVMMCRFYDSVTPTTSFAHDDSYKTDDCPEWFPLSIAESADNPAQLSWAEDEEYLENDDRRRRASPHKFIRKAKHLGWFDVPDADHNRLAELLGVHLVDRTYTMNVVYGYDVVEAYNEEYFGSCMSDHSEYYRGQTDFYAENPDVVGMLRCELNGKLEGRALVWHTNEGVTFLDRMYPDDGGPHTVAMREYAKEQGWAVRRGTGLDGYSDQPLSVEVKDVGCYPYMDTFAFACRPDSTGMFVLHTDSDGVYDYIMHSTDNYAPWVKTCASCDRALQDEENVVGRDDNTVVCDNCFDNYYVEITDNNNNRFFTHESNIIRCHTLASPDTPIPVHHADDRLARCDVSGVFGLVEDMIVEHGVRYLEASHPQIVAQRNPERHREAIAYKVVAKQLFDSLALQAAHRGINVLDHDRLSTFVTSENGTILLENLA